MPSYVFPLPPFHAAGHQLSQNLPDLLLMKSNNFLTAHPSVTDGSGYVEQANQMAARLGRAYCYSCACTGLYFMLDPILKIVASKWRGVPYVRELPMPMK